MEKNWVKVYTSQDFFKAELVRQVLIDNEIPAVLIDKRISPYPMGPIEVYIHQDNLIIASEIILTSEL